MAHLCSSKKPAGTTRGRRRKSCFDLKFHLFFIWVVLILTHLPLSYGLHHHHHHHHRRSSLPSSRKAMFFKTAQPQFHADVSTSNQPPVGAAVFDEDKRIIHTGPNPLHN
ncbi:hypothetical protein R6Q59_030297 [Mikania micrantha]